MPKTPAARGRRHGAGRSPSSPPDGGPEGLDGAASVEATPVAAPDDSEFPQLCVTKDPRLMLEFFRAHLRPVAGKVYFIEDCTPFRFRYHPYDEHWVLQYQLRVAEPASGLRWLQWVTGILFGDPVETERLWVESRAESPEQEVPPEWLRYEPVSFVPELRMLVEVFPFDRRLRNLAQVMDGATRQLDPLILARLGEGPWQPAGHVLQPRQYRAELGAVLAYSVHARDPETNRSATSRCYLKVYGNERGKDAMRILEMLSRKEEARSRPYGVTAPIAYLEDLRTLAMEEAQGHPLDQILLRGEDTRPSLRLVSRAVAALNRDRLPIAKQRPLNRHLATLERASLFAQWACPEAKDGVRAIVASVTEELEPVTPGPTHGDLKPDHIFLAGNRATFIDIDSAALGDPVRDPARLFARIVCRLGLDSMTAAQATAAATEFREEYFRHTPGRWRDRFAAHVAGCCIEVAGEFFKQQVRDWHGRMLNAIETGQRALAGGVA